MSAGVAYLFAIIVLIGAFLVLMNLFQERHFLLKYLFIMGILLAAYFIPTAIYEIPKSCSTVVANSTAVDANVTSYEYKQVCFTTVTTIPDTFYQVYSWVYFIMIIYFVIRMFYDLYQHYLAGRKWTEWESWLR